MVANDEMCDSKSQGLVQTENRVLTFAAVVGLVSAEMNIIID